mgnify:CR=1 FL=1
MGRKKKKEALFFTRVEVAGVAAEGKALGRVDDKVLFIPFAAPGDVVDVRITKRKRNFMEGSIQQVHKWSDERVTPFCEHFGTCGGCKWQHLSYERQLHHKQQQVIDHLVRIGKVDLRKVEVSSIAAATDTIFYRNKLEFTFSNKKWLSREVIDSGEPVTTMEALGFHIPVFFDKVLDINKCWLQPEPSNEIRLAVKEFALKEGMTFFDLRSNRGMLRNLIIRNTNTGELMILMVFGERDQAVIDNMMTFLSERFPNATTIAYMINEKANSSIADLDPIIFRGKPFIEEEMEGLRFQIGPKSFFQTNSKQARKLYGIARDFAGLTGSELVYDLYTGTGTIACFMARHAKKVIGIEYVQEAVEHAKVNAWRNGIENCDFVAGDMAAVLNDGFMDKNGYPHVIITDPPRAGMHPKVVRQIAESGADKIVYVSCNSATQARDLEMLSDKYEIVKSQAVDMFPHTHHVENVVLLERKRS